MLFYLSQFFLIFIYILLSFSLSLIFFILSFVVSYQKENVQKISSYECGFDPFDDARSTFDIRFYLVCILFIIFDLEISFLFPWSVALYALPLFAFCSMTVFLTILTFGFAYEWIKGALEWE